MGSLPLEQEMAKTRLGLGELGKGAVKEMAGVDGSVEIRHLLRFLSSWVYKTNQAEVVLFIHIPAIVILIMQRKLLPLLPHYTAS